MLEWPRAGLELMSDIAERVVTHGGAALIVDYGYEGPAFGDTLQAADVIDLTYLADKSAAAKVTLRLGTAQEVYTVVDGNDLADGVNGSLAYRSLCRSAGVNGPWTALCARYRANGLLRGLRMNSTA